MADGFIFRRVRCSDDGLARLGVDRLAVLRVLGQVNLPAPDVITDVERRLGVGFSVRKGDASGKK